MSAVGVAIAGVGISLGWISRAEVKSMLVSRGRGGNGRFWSTLRESLLDDAESGEGRGEVMARVSTAAYRLDERRAGAAETSGVVIGTCPVGGATVSRPSWKVEGRRGDISIFSLFKLITGDGGVCSPCVLTLRARSKAWSFSRAGFGTPTTD
jgi:hypothetical protein